MEKEIKKTLQDLVDFTKEFESKKVEIIVTNAKLTLLNKIMQRSFESGVELTNLRDYIVELIEES